MVKRTGGAASAVTVDYATSDGTAQAGQDYGETTGTLTFGTTETSRTILVPLLNDRIVEGNETFFVTLSNPGGGATLGALVQTTVTVVDDDAGGVLKFSAAAYRIGYQPLWQDELASLLTIAQNLKLTRTGTEAALLRELERVPGVGSAVMYTRDASLEL